MKLRSPLAVLLVVLAVPLARAEEPKLAPAMTPMQQQHGADASRNEGPARHDVRWLEHQEQMMKP